MQRAFEPFFDKVLHNVPVIRYSSNPKSGHRTADFHYVFQTNKTVGLLFTGQISSASASFTQQLRKLYESMQEKQRQQTFSSPAKIRKFFNGSSKSQKQRDQQAKENGTGKSGETFELIVVSLDADMQSLQKTIAETGGWWTLSPDQHMTKTRLLRFFRVQSVPTLVLVDGASKRVITADGRRAMMDDPEGCKFPWWPPSLQDVFSGLLLHHDHSAPAEGAPLQQLPFSAIKGSVKGILFAGNWCPPCRAFSQQLVKTYNKVKEAGHDFEVIFSSSDRTLQSFQQFFATMPWKAFPFEDERIKQLTRLYNVNGIPALLILDENDRLITRHGRNAILADPEAQNFPWKPQPLVELTEFTAPRLKEDISVVLFTDGSAEEVCFARGVLEVLATNELLQSSNDQNGNREDGVKEVDLVHMEPLKFCYSGEDPISDSIMDSLGLQEAPLPLLCILDVFADSFYICEQPDMSEEIVQNFVTHYRMGQLKPQQLPLSATRICSTGQLGGIPIGAISAALSAASASPTATLQAQSTNGNTTL